jgi:hypothetical protein
MGLVKTKIDELSTGTGLEVEGVVNAKREVGAGVDVVVVVEGIIRRARRDGALTKEALTGEETETVEEEDTGNGTGIFEEDLINSSSGTTTCTEMEEDPITSFFLSSECCVFFLL